MILLVGFPLGIVVGRFVEHFPKVYFFRYSEEQEKAARAD